MSTLEALQIFVRVAEYGSFTRAAESLGLLKDNLQAMLQLLRPKLAR